LKGNLTCYASLVLIILLLLGCTPAIKSPIEQGSTDVSPLIRNPNLSIAPNNPLAAILTFDTDRPTEATVTLSSNDHTVTAPSSDGLTTNHRLHVLGLRAREKYAVTISVVDEGGNVSYDRSLRLKTAPLPDDFPPLEVTLSEPDRMQPGVTVFNVRRWNPDRDEKWGMLIGVDEQGEVVWYHHDECMIHFVTQTRNGNLLYLCRRGEAIEVNTMGERVRAWAPAELDPSVDFFHHEILEMPSGNFLVLTRENRQSDGYDRGGQQVAYDVLGDVIVEFTPEGVIVNRWSVFDMLDPHRIGPSFHLPRGKQLDWTHGNSLFYDEGDDSITVSLRHQDWVIKFDRETGELIWRLGAEGDFSLVGDGEWFFQQHAAKLLDDRWLLYDNGKDRPGIKHAYQLYGRVSSTHSIRRAKTLLRGLQPRFGSSGIVSPFTPRSWAKRISSTTATS